MFRHMKVECERQMGVKYREWTYCSVALALTVSSSVFAYLRSCPFAAESLEQI